MTDPSKPVASDSRLQSPGFAAASANIRELLAAPTFIHEVLASALQQVCRLTSCETAALYLFDDAPNKPRLRVFAQQGLAQDEKQSFQVLTRGLSLASRAVESGLVTTCGRAPGGAVYCEPLAGVCASSAAAPVAMSDWTLGALLVMTDGQEVISEDAQQALVEQGHLLGNIVVGHAFWQQVSEERDRYARVASNVRDCIWTSYFEPELRLALMTDGIFDLSGYSATELLRRPELWLEMIHPEDRGTVLQQRAEILAGQLTDVHHRVRIIHKNGDLRWLHTRGRAVRDAQGWRMDAISTDVTDHVRLEEKVRRADRLSAVGILAGGIAHEYNNLHFAILGTLDLLLMRDDLDESLRNHINRVRESAERASDITNQLVSFARGGSGAREIMDVAELIEATLGMVQKEFSTKGIEVDIKRSPNPLRIRGNRAELGQVLINLVINAQQAMQDSPSKRLGIATGTREGRVFISITDTGQGIQPENLPRLFDPFFTTKGAAGSWSQERAATDAYLPGRGLGLSVAQSIIEEHGGDIEVESEVGCGARFTIYLPPPEASEVEAVDTSALVQVRKGRILVADDEAPVRQVCRELLEQLGYEVAEAKGGAEAIELLSNGDFDLTLVDLQMPDMDGLQLIGRINEIPKKRRPAKLIITGNIDDLPAETCAELGIAGLLQKRASLSELVSKVQLALGTKRG
jgi:PAS domain S-box-containing protein